MPAAFTALERAVGAKLTLFQASAPSGLRLTPAQARSIALLIWRNEGQSRYEALTDWNQGEAFASLGIGHFIWYPAAVPVTFTESFPPLVRFLADNGAPVPPWLASAPPCPWPDRAAFFADYDGPRLRELRALLSATFDLQARFLANRSEAALPRILEELPPAERAAIRRRYADVASVANGVYALVDYVNFKGEGVSPAERYSGLGWGLLQVLQEMRATPQGQAAAREFSQAAARVLSRRVALSPVSRHEERWLPGWLKRVETYQDALP